MRLRKNRRFILLLFSFLSLITLKGQTLYWVGGNGNFNDPKHWSLTSGGTSANQVPGSSTNVVFDDNSGRGLVAISLGSNSQVKSLIALNAFNLIRFTGAGSSTFDFSGSVRLSQRVDWRASTQLVFNASGSDTNEVDFSTSTLQANVTLNAGIFKIITISVDDAHTLRFGSGSYAFNNAVISAGNIINEDSRARLDVKDSYFRATGKFKIADAAVVKPDGMSFTGDINSQLNYQIPSALSGSSKYSPGSINVVCPVTISLTPACSGSCTGVLTVSLSPTCTNTPYSVQVSNATCPAAAAAMSSTNIPSVYTYTSACACSANYIIVVRDGSNSNQAATNTANFTPNSAIIFDNNVSPQCSNSCDGTLTGNIIGTAPFSVSVTASSPSVTIPSFNTTNGDYSISNMCAGNYTFIIRDASGCISTQVNTLFAPAPLLPNPVTTSISCNGATTGAFSITPSGGTANYTVTFSNSTTLTTNGSVVAASNLGPGPISATITDSHGCLTSTASVITQPPASLTAVFTQTNLSCNGVCIGAASSTVSGGTTPYSYSWTPGPGSGSLATGLCAGIKTLNVSDFNGCTTAVQVFTITEPPAITVTPTSTNVVCSGSCTGVAAVSASGGTGAFSFTWVAPGPSTVAVGPTSSLTNLCAGTYTVYTKDANNCSPAPVVISITQPPTITLTAASQSISCFGANDGSATVTVAGGNGAPYSYNWAPGAMTTSVITNLGPNIYTVTVQDAASCAKSTTVNIVQPTGLVPNVTFTNLTCNAANAPCDGKINALPSGGTAPYTYTLVSTFSTITTQPLYTGLCAGVYTVIVKDNSNCPQQSIVTLTQPGALVPTISTTSVNCYGGNTGGLTGSPGSGGTPSYTLTWVTPTGTASGSILSNQIAGNYTLTVMDSKSCTAQTTATVTQPSSITIAVSTSSISCFTTCNGVLNSTVSGGTGGYTYAWTNSLSVNVGSAPTATGLCPGPYTLTVTDGNSCVKTASSSVQSPQAITLTATATQVNCFGDSNGSATVTASGGTSPYSFQFNSSPVVTNTTGILSGQPSGTYIATVTDFLGCSKTVSFAINTPTALTAAISGTGSCNMCTGSATMTPSFGTGAYTYSWTSSLGGSFPTTSTLASLCPGTYTATVTDVKGCVITRTIALQQVIGITINVGTSGILCYGASTGSATAVASGGSGVYSYSWSPSGQTTSVLSGVSAGTYTVKVTDTSVPSTCSLASVVTLSQPPAITVTTTQTNVSCYSFSTGAISSSVSGGTGPSYSYTWSPGGLNTSSITGIPAGIYTLNVRDANLCSASKTISVTQPSNIAITLAVANPAGCVPSLANGSICPTASGGSGSGYTFTLTPGNATLTSGCFSGLGGGAYSILVRDGTGCSNSAVTTLSNPSGPTITVSSNSVACYGYSTAIASATATGLTPTFTFSWTPSVTSTSTGSTTTASNLPAGLYLVTAVDGNSCVATQSITISQATAYTLNPTVSNLQCNNVSTGSIVVAPAGGSPAYGYTWTPPSGIISSHTPSITGLAAGIYTLTLGDTHNCNTPFTFTVTQPPAISLTAVTSSLQCYNICTGSIAANASGGTGSINYSWTPLGGNSPTVTNLCATTGTNPAAYTLTVTDFNQCSQVATYTIGQPTQLTNTVNVLSASCSNSCNAVASQTASGGVGGYNYSWISSTVTTSSLGSLCAGVYTAVVTDANGCSNSKQYTVTPPAPLSVTLTPTNPMCNGACNGSITTITSGAQGTVSYNWSPAGSGQSPTGLCASPTAVYTLVATDANSCRVTAVTTLVNPPAVLATVTSTNPLCHNGTNGQAAVTLSNAATPLSYTWIPTGPPTQTTQSVSGLAAGPYTVLVKDANNCQAFQTFTLGNPSALVVNTSIIPASCSQSNGAITANPSGGTPGSPVPYTYTWTGVVSSSSVVTGIPAGPYTVAVSDGLGCTTTVNILLNNSSGPSTIPILSNSIVCNASCTGAASVNVSGIVGGSSPYTASWLAPSPSTVNPLSNLCAGSYTAKVVDGTGCIGFTFVTIAQPPPIVNTPSIGLPLCPGICNGSITLNTSGGNAPYTYTWIPIGSSNPTVTNLCAGIYTVVVGYNGVCSDTSVVNLPDQSSITIVPSVTNNICYGTCNGVINLSVTGGTSPYSAGWSNSQTGLNLNNVCNGNYTVVISDHNGCSNTATAAITSGAAFSYSTSIFSPSCGVCNGGATVTASGGTGPYSYSWSNSATTPTVSNLCAGVYQVIVSDAQSCAQTLTVVVNNSNGFSAENFTVQGIPCSGACVGAVTVQAVGGTAPISYSWLNPVSSSSVISNLCPNTYFVQMSDVSGCIRISSVAINPQVTLSVSPFLYLPTCGVSDGSINLVISGGTPSYNIVWNPPAGLTTSLTSLNAGVYSYTVTESGTNSCSISQSINLSNANGPVVQADQTNINCHNACTGSITTVATGSNTPFNYSWSNGTHSSTVTNLCPGIITLTVTDQSGCVAFRSFTLTDNPLFELGIANVHSPACYGDCTGSINLDPTGGVPPYTYSWTVASATTNPLRLLCDGVYTAVVTDAKGCKVISPSYTIASASAMVLGINSTSSSCSEVADGKINITTSGGVPEYLYLWQGPSNFTASTQNLVNIYAGTYSLDVTDNLGCKKDTVVAIVPSLTITANAGSDQTICSETGTVMLAASGGSGSSNYKWYAATDKNKQKVLGTGGSYLVQNLTQNTGFVLVVSSSVASCYSEDEVNVDVYSPPPVDAGRDVTIPIYATVTIGGHPSNWGAASLTWTPAMYLDDTNAANPVASNTVNMTYTLTVTDVNGCFASDSVNVLLYPKLNITSGFTPNNDGKNDFWIIDYIEQFPAVTVEIFNRWGDVIFSSTGYQTPFDGKYKGADLPVGTYYYVININHPGYPKPITGPLTIFR